MKRIRQMLLDNYVGAIAIGFIFAQAVFQFINILIQLGTEAWARQQGDRSLSASPYFNWSQFLMTLASVLLNAGAGVVLLYWLYSGPKTIAPDEAGEGESLETRES